jgi:hypothetical protein
VTSPVRQLIAIHYHRDRHWDAEYTAAPDWDDVAAAFRRMDDHFYPIVQLSCAERADDETMFNVIGGDGRFALFHQMGDWQYSDPAGSDDEVRLWTSDQGYFCAQRNVLTDIDKVLRIAKTHYESGSYAGLDAVG